jgi:hypothetical protein
MAGLDPAIHATCVGGLDRRVKPVDDSEGIVVSGFGLQPFGRPRNDSGELE